MEIRPMEDKDLDAVVKIEEATFPMPFSRPFFRKLLRHGAYFNWVVEEAGEVIGYAMYSCVADESELINIAVCKSWRQRGVGKKLMEHVLNHVKGLGVRKIFLEVRPSNNAAQEYYKKFGFSEIAVRRGYYHDTGEDALIFAKELG